MTAGVCTVCQMRPATRQQLCGTCYARQRRAGALRVRSRRRLADTIEDVEWMLATGETHPEAIAARLGYRPGTLRVILSRAGRPDLVAQLTPNGTDRVDVVARIAGRQ